MLAPETGKVSWVSMGLWRVLFLAEVDRHPSKSQDPSSGSEVIVLEVKPGSALPAISGRTSSRSKPALGCSAATSWRLAPRNLNHSKVRTHAATGLKCHSVTSHCLDFYGCRNNSLKHHVALPGVRQRHIPSVPPTIHCGGCGGCLLEGAHDAKIMERFTKVLGIADPITPASSPASLLFKCRGHSGSKAHSASSSVSLFLPEYNLTMSSLGGPGAGGEGAPEKRGTGRPKGSGKKIISPTATPSMSRKRGRPLGSRNQKTLTALAAAAAAAPAAAASIGVAPAIGGEGVPRKRGPGRPKGSGKKAVTVATVAPSPACRRGRLPGSKNNKTLAALAATASGSVGPSAAASSPAGPSRLQPTLPALQLPAYTSAEGWSTFIVPVLAGAKDRLRLPSQFVEAI
jgi:hypothetical protein